MIDLAPIRAILLDIEGTTTPLRFVHDLLFPHARRHMLAFLRDHAQEAEVHGDLAGLRMEHARDTAAGRNPPPWGPEEVASAAAYARWLMDHDRKATPLKSLQGRIWQQGYAAGELRGQVYPDVPPAFERWHGAGRTLAIFSSGSVLAQRLLFTHSEAGDLERFLSAHFDTTTGPKAEPESYRRIAAALGRAPGEWLFFSDVPAELDAAASAGMATGLVVREAPGLATTHEVLRDFGDVA